LNDITKALSVDLLNKLKIYHFNNGKGGGVLSVIRNLLRFSNNPLIENHIIYTVNKEQIPVFIPEQIEGAVTTQIFYYSPTWNFYYTCRQLSKLLPDEKALVVAHDWLELGMMSNLGLQNAVVQFVHGAYDYYYQLAKLHDASIDLFIAVAQNIESRLIETIPHRRNDIGYLRFPVPCVNHEEKEVGDNINIIFIGRLEAAKGYLLLPVIAKKVNESNSNVHWHVVGSVAEPANENITWDEHVTVRHYGDMLNDAVLELLKSMQILILPSVAEGMPVIIIEAMKAGVIPLVNNIDGGIQELVIDDKTGYKIENNSIAGYVEKINSLSTDKSQRIKMSYNSVIMANELFDPVINTIAIENKIVEMFATPNKNKAAVKTYGSRLDEQWVPNYVVNTIRKISKK